MRVAVTGATGLLGSALVTHFASSQDVDVIALTSGSLEDAHTRWRAAADGEWNSRSVEVIETAPRGIVDAVEKAGRLDWVVNCAFPRARGGLELAAGLDYQQALFSAAARSEVGAVLNMSSQSVYRSDRTEPADETAELDLDTPYATAKYAAELFAQAYLSDIPIVQGRLSSLVAAGFEQRVVNKLVRRAMDGHDLTITTPRVVFDFMDVRDAVGAIRAVISSEPKAGVEHLNIGSGVPYTLGGIADAVGAVVNEEFGQSISVTSLESDERRSSALDCGRLRAEYGFEPTYALTDTIRDIAKTMIGNRREEGLE